MAEKEVGKSLGDRPVLRHASKRKSGTWGPDDYDVIHDGRDIGRIFKAGGGVPEDHPWMWTITGAERERTVARILCRPGRGQGEVRRDVACVVGS